MKKSCLILCIFIFCFLILEISKTIWVETNVALLEEKSSVDDPSVGDLFLKLQKVSPKNAKVWSLTAQYYFKKMLRSPMNQERLGWIEKAYQSAYQSVKCNPVDQQLAIFLNNTLRWKEVLSALFRSSDSKGAD